MIKVLFLVSVNLSTSWGLMVKRLDKIIIDEEAVSEFFSELLVVKC